MLQLSEQGFAYFRGKGLTKREVEVLDLLLRCKTEVELAEKIFVHPKTVKYHKTNIYKKLGAQRLNGVLVVVMPFTEPIPKPKDADALPVGSKTV